jgi:hypothetical protein
MKSILVEQGILDGEPIVAVSYLEPIGDWDSGLAAWSSEPNQVRDCEPVHICCFLNEHPEAGEGMDVARAHGEAIRTGNHWVPGGRGDDAKTNVPGHLRHVHFSPKRFQVAFSG